MSKTNHSFRIKDKELNSSKNGKENECKIERKYVFNSTPKTGCSTVLDNELVALAALQICDYKKNTSGIKCIPNDQLINPTCKGTIIISFLPQKMLTRQPYHLFFFLLLVAVHQISLSQSIFLDDLSSRDNRTISQEKTNGNNNLKNGTGSNMISGNSPIVQKDYLEKLNNFERNVAAVLIKVAYGTTSTTKRSIPDTSYSLGLTTVATPFLTTQRYSSVYQQQGFNGHQRNYELDLERDHALPTSAPNADILKSNNNPTYPNPNRHHPHDRERNKNTAQYNSTPIPSIPNILKKSNGGQSPTSPMYPGDIPSYSPPSRAFFTPPLPPEYQNPFADKPTLRGTNNEGLIAVNRRPIPPPSLMPSQDRIPIRPPDLGGNSNDAVLNPLADAKVGDDTKQRPIESTISLGTGSNVSVSDRKKTLNTPARASGEDFLNEKTTSSEGLMSHEPIKRQEVLPNIRRILGSNGKNGDIPAVLLKQVTQRPIISFRHPPSSPVVLVDKNLTNETTDADGFLVSPNINQSKYQHGQLDFYDNANHTTGTTPSAAAAIGDVLATSFSYATTKAVLPGHKGKKSNTVKELGPIPGGRDTITGSSAAASAQTTWAWAWNIHIYLSVVVFTILSVYSLYKMLTYNKLTHLFAQSYFVCIHLILILICIMRIFFLCFDAYNAHGTFNMFTSELLLNLPSTFLTVAFSILILYLFLKSLNHKNNRYSALIRPLTVVVGCGVHVVLCITLHYVESYTLKNHNLYFQQQQQQQYIRRQQLHSYQGQVTATMSPSAIMPPPPRVLTLICQIIYIFICLSLGLLYLYMYRILKRILRSKSQNYIHGYQNLSYAIHITIATALLFVLLAAIQIFGAICISASRQTDIVDVDWIQWGYQFSLRLIEIAIVTLISWVTGLKNSIGHDSLNTVNGEIRMVGSGLGTMGAFGQASVSSNNPIREKNAGNGSGTHNSNVTNFFLPCTSTSSQEHFETDYPAICNANTNLHTYTMRTGKLIYDDSYALNSIGPTTAATSCSRPCEYQLQEPMYQRPYDTGSIGSALNGPNGQNYPQASQNHKQQHQLHQMRFHEHPTHMTTDYTTDTAPDHYENPNFSLRTAIFATAEQKLKEINDKNGVGSTSDSGSSHQQVVLLQNDNCYSEPLEHENKHYEFNIFERPVFNDKLVYNVQPNSECFADRQKISNGPERKFDGNGTIDRNFFENKITERRNSNSTNSYSSNAGGGGRCASYNSYERAFFNGVCNTNHMSSGVITLGAPATGLTREATIASVGTQRIIANGTQTIGISDRAAHFYQRENGRTPNLRSLQGDSDMFKNMPIRQHQLQKLPYDDNSDDEEEEDDIISGSNVECTNLISNDNGSVTIAEDNATNSVSINSTTLLAGATANKKLSVDPLLHSKLHAQLRANNGKFHSELCTASSASVASASSNSCTTSSASDSMLVADQGFLRFRSIEDQNGTQNANVETERPVVSSLRFKSCSATVNDIDC
ncbi:uncharacterized protein LOC108108672 isoform X1 [Drosophila eugracilis]|uniref:uncharacterized protein LOC108108672 isoform X1 n=1 Tax=Drosophila eugracilis TaxID=29029 RepID=UPI001BD9CAC0|nr:uncharacterized protein LOC108108672 isoform X1 [Drosophila eugracilis]XP_041674539.1 uncharacterized protein LOC108108672 isoform X1 [Drosophila eugracilis]